MAGASGLVGREILRALLVDDSVAVVHTVGRRTLSITHPKLVQHVADFAALPPLPTLNEAFIALGTTIKIAGSQSAFRSVDHDAILAVARTAIESGATKIGVVSAMGADSGSGVFYNRVKGETEDALRAMPLQTLAIARPSFLAGDREALGQPRRTGERWALAVSRVLRPLMPANYRSIQPEQVARALIRSVRGPAGTHVLLSGSMQSA